MSGPAFLFRANLGADPADSGWTCAGAYPDGATGFEGDWQPAGRSGRQACLRVRTGLWRTPHLPVRPLHYYRARFMARTLRGGYYAFCFYDRRGRMLASDEYNSVAAARGWKTHMVFTQAREDAASLRLAFIARDDDLRIASTKVSEAADAAVLAWGDRLYATLPPVHIDTEAGRFTHLSGTLQRLRTGGELRLLVLGDSIANDLSNSQFHLLIQRRYPGTTVRLLRSIRSGTGCTYYRRHVQRYVIAKRPHLVIVGGISHQNSVAAIRSVVEQSRAALGQRVAFLVLTGAIMEPGYAAGRSGDSDHRRRAGESELAFYDKLARNRAALRIATLDMRSAWEAYLADCGHPRAWYQRDPIHANARGKQILGRMIEQCFDAGRRFSI